MSPPTATRPSRRRRLARSAWAASAWLAAIVFFFPVLWMVRTAFKPESDVYTRTPHLVFSPTLAQFRAVFSSGIGPYLANSALASVISTFLALILAAPAAYALSVRPMETWRDALFLFISTRDAPGRGRDHPPLPGRAWPGCAGRHRHADRLPREVLEAARVDGAAMRQELTAVLLPMVLPGIVATSLICLILSWNEFFPALNLTSFRAATIPVFLVGFITGEGLYWAKLAAATLACLPVLLADWIAQRQLVRGLSMGAVT